MSSRKNKYISQQSGLWYIRYKDPVSGKWTSFSTGLKAVKSNEPVARRIRDEFFETLKKQENQEVKQGTIADAFEHFKTINQNRADSTKSTYEYFYRFLCAFVNADSDIKILDKKKCERFLLWMQEKTTLSQNTQFGVQKNLLKFLGFLFENEYLAKSFTINKSVRVSPQVNEPLIFTEEDRHLILAELTNRGKNLNFRLAIKLLMYSGLRPSDILSLRYSSFDLQENTMKVYMPKVNRWLNRPIHKELLTIINEALEQAPKDNLEAKVFNYADAKAMGKAFSRYLVEIGLDSRGYNLRTFRKDFITRGQVSGVDIAVIADLVGHTDIRTTKRFYTNLPTKVMRENLDKIK